MLELFGCRLEKLGFSVKTTRSGELGQCSDEELRSKLYELTLTTDICCVMVSQDAAASEWVRLEYQEAAAIYGRIIFTFNNLPTGKFGFEQPSRYSNRPRMVGLQVRHTTIERTPQTMFCWWNCVTVPTKAGFTEQNNMN